MKRFPSGLMGTCCIPWDDSGRFAEPIFRRAVRRTLARGTSLLYVFGTAGEGYAVTDSQFGRIVATFADEMRQGRAEPMVGLIDLSLGAILERLQRCRDQGVRRFQVSLPSWGALSDRELFAFFDAVCAPHPDCQFMHYNLPRAKRLLTGAEYGRLARQHENLVATKNCGDSLSLLRGLQLDAPDLQHFFSEAGYVYGSLFGECGLLGSLVMNWPRLRELWEAGRQHDWPTMITVQKETQIVLQTLFEVIRDPRIDGAYDKVYEKLYDPEYPLRLLPPYVGASDAEFSEFRTRLGERLPSWLPSVDS